MSDPLGPGDLVLCVNASPNHVTGEPVPLVAGETYRVFDLWEFACPCGRSDALLDVGVGWAWCQSRFRKLPKPKARAKSRTVTTPKKVEPVSWSALAPRLRFEPRLEAPERFPDFLRGQCKREAHEAVAFHGIEIYARCGCHTGFLKQP
jgi:hypothetical protein